MRKHIIKFLLFILPLYTTTQLMGQPYSTIPLDSAMRYVNIKEATGKNDGYFVEKFLRSVGRKKGDSWCAAFTSYNLTVGNAKLPTTRSGLARSFKSKGFIDAKKVYYGLVTIPKGSLVGFEHIGSISGHIEFVVEDWRGQSGKTLGGNTSNGLKGSQSDGNGVYLRKRSISLVGNFRITWFNYVK